MVQLTTDPIPYAEFIMRFLMQHPSPEAPEKSIAETEEALDGDRWFWADDNAKILEFLAVPQLWSCYPKQCADILRFIDRLCYGPFILRRIGHARLDQITDAASGAARFVHTFMHLSSDLARGIVNVGMRFHDIRTARNLIFTGNAIEFTYGERRHKFSVEESIIDYSIVRDGPELFLKHTSEIKVPTDGGEKRLGLLDYVYTIDARTMFVNVAAELRLEDEEVSDVILTIANSDLSHGENDVFYTSVQFRSASETVVVDCRDDHVNHPAKGVSYWSLIQGGYMRGFSLAAHVIPSDPDRLSSIELTAGKDGRWHSAASCYSFPGKGHGKTLRVSETRVITSGGFYELASEYEDMFKHFLSIPKDDPIDFSISYDYGAEINCFARAFRTLSTISGIEDQSELRQLSRDLFDRYFDYFDNILMRAQESDPAAIFSRPLAFAAYGLVDMYFVTSDEKYRQSLRRVVDLLLAFERPFLGEEGNIESAFLMGLVQTALPFVDCHSAILLALARALPVLEDSSLITRLDRGIDAYRIETMGIELGDIRKQDLLYVGFPPGGHQRGANAYWNFCAGITLRLFKYLSQSQHQATKEIFDRHKFRIAAHRALLEVQILRSLRDRGGAIEIKTAILSAEGNSETQPWAALGLVEDSGDLPPQDWHLSPPALISNVPIPGVTPPLESSEVPGAMLERSDVEAGYRWILGRPPESEDAIRTHMVHRDIATLREVLLRSGEFRKYMESLS
jgi:hypothetical protein